MTKTTTFSLFSLIFFFQAEDGIRDRNVTGVQTCALPIWRRAHVRDPERAHGAVVRRDVVAVLEIGRASCRERRELSVAGQPLKRRTKRRSSSVKYEAAAAGRSL